MMTLHGIEHGPSLETLQHDEGQPEPDEDQRKEKPADMSHAG